MLKKIRNICLLFLVCVSAGILSACCGPSKLNVNVIFQDVDPNMGIEDYVEKIEIGEGIKIDFVIPEGYAHESMTATINGQDLEFDVQYLDNNLETEYYYATEKRISVELPKIISNCDIVFQMKDVRKKQFEIEVSDDILNVTKYTTTVDKNTITTTQLSVVSIKPESANRLLTLNYDSNIIEERTFENNKMTVEYGEYIVLVYDRPNTNSELKTIYSEIGYFTNEKNISSIGVTRFAQYSVALRGNSYYTFQKRNAVGSARLFYLGKIQDNIKFYNSIPNYEEEKGFVLENNENKFSLLTNMQDYSSDMLTINVYMPTNKTYNSSDSSLDQVDGVTLERIEKYDNENNLKNDAILYDYLNRYDVYNMYIGSDLENDPLLTRKERESLPKTLYISVDTEDELKDGLNFNLLYHEKQNPYYDNYVKLTDFVESQNGQKFIKIDKKLIENFLMDRSIIDGENTIYYQTGNAILYIEIDKSFIDQNRLSHNFDYYTINAPVKYNSMTSAIDYDYTVRFYILNEDGTKDYGFVDLQNYGHEAEDYVYFRADKLYETDEYGHFIVDGYQNYVYKNNLYVDVIGPKYNNFYSPVIEDIYMSIGGYTMIEGGLKVKDPVEFNGLLGIQVVGLSDYQGCTWQKNITVAPYLTVANNYSKVLNFENMYFSNSDDMIFVTNNVNMSTDADFIRVDEITKYNDLNIKFGATTDIFYFVVADSNINFDVYLAELNSEGNFVAKKDETRIISATKPLLDIAGNKVDIVVNGRPYTVMVKYQYMNVYNIKLYDSESNSYKNLLGEEHYAYESTEGVDT